MMLSESPIAGATWPEANSLWLHLQMLARATLLSS
jgi:hypothetical protein